MFGSWVLLIVSGSVSQGLIWMYLFLCLGYKVCEHFAVSAPRCDPRVFRYRVQAMRHLECDGVCFIRLKSEVFESLRPACEGFELLDGLCLSV